MFLQNQETEKEYNKLLKVFYQNPNLAIHKFVLQLKQWI